MSLESSQPAKTVAIVQSNYIPWKGYFDLINMVDEFILYDDVQYTRRDWRNRNLVKTPQGLQWLTVPVEVKGKYHQKIRETRVSESSWCQSHWSVLMHNYARAAAFDRYGPVIEELYRECEESYLSQINHRFIKAICDMLGIRTPIRWSWDFPQDDGRNERLLSLCKGAKATRYLSGPSAKGYLDEALFRAEGIDVAWMDYSGYPEYRQLFGPFQHGVTILDLIFNEGEAAHRFLKSYSVAEAQERDHADGTT